MPIVQSHPGRNRFNSLSVALVAPELNLTSEFVFARLRQGLLPECPEDVCAVLEDNDSDQEQLDIELTDTVLDESVDVIEWVDWKLAVETAVANMTPWQRTTLVLRLQGYSFAEIARYYHRSEGSPRMAYRRACRHLRQCLVEHQLNGNT